MNISGFTAEDFNVFKIDGLEPRMEALVQRIRPKLDNLGTYFSQELSVLAGEEMFPHVAKHARRTINPPNDTWVAFAPNKRGYKMLPHFQIGLWETHAFVWYAVIYEAPSKGEIGKKFMDNAATIKNLIPDDFVWSTDHTKPEAIPHKDLAQDDLEKMFQRLQSVKKAELLCGIQIPRDESVKMSDDAFVQTIHDVFVKLLPLYKMK